MEPREARARAHSNCVVCSLANSRSLRLEFVAPDDGGVQARFDCDQAFEGYTGMLHGGVIASLLDGAMTNCMFARDIVATTAELNIRFRHPLVVGRVATVRAWIERSSPPLHLLRAEVVQDARPKATAFGKFMEQPHLADGEGSF